MAPPIETNYYGIQSIHHARGHNPHIASIGKIYCPSFCCELDAPVLIYVSDQVIGSCSCDLHPGHFAAIACPSLNRIETSSLKTNLKFAGNILSFQTVRGTSKLGHGKGHKNTRNHQNNKQFDNRIPAFMIGFGISHCVFSGVVCVRKLRSNGATGDEERAIRVPQTAANIRRRYLL